MIASNFVYIVSNLLFRVPQCCNIYCYFFIYQQFLYFLCFLPSLFSVMVTYQEIKHRLTSQQVQKVTSAGRY